MAKMTAVIDGKTVKLRENRIGASRYDAVINVVIAAFLLLFSLICLYPVLHALFASLSDPVFVRHNNGLILYPHGFTLEGYRLVFQNTALVRSVGNSVLYVATGVALNMALTTAGAYVLSRRDLMLNKLFMKLIVFTMFFGGGLLPLYMLVRDLGMKDTVWAIILPVAVSQWNMIILRTAFQEVPEEIVDSAKIDGASNLRVMILIALPLIKATFAIITLYYVVGHWNSWFNAMVFLQSRDKFPLQLIMREILILNDTSKITADNITQSEQVLNNRELIKYCTTVVAMVPMFVVFPFVQKHFTKGVFIGSLKT